MCVKIHTIDTLTGFDFKTVYSIQGGRNETCRQHLLCRLSVECQQISIITYSLLKLLHRALLPNFVSKLLQFLKINVEQFLNN